MIKMIILPKQKRIKELLHYLPDTGELIWKVNRGCKRAGSVAGSIDRSNGYVHVKIDCITYRAHRLIWVYMTGEPPKEQIDHIDHNGLNNAWNNLREATHQENHMNESLRCTNIYKVVGINWNTGQRKWHSQIGVDNKTMHLGYFKDFFEAVCARKSAELKYRFHPNHGM